MSDERQSFQNVVSTLTEKWRDAKSFSTWDPDEGIYMFRATSIQRGIAPSDGTPWWKVSGIIVQPDDKSLEGHDWSPFYFSSKWFGFMKDFTSELLGTVPDNPVDADKLLDTVLGWTLLVEVKHIVRKNKNVVDKKILRVIEKAV